MKVTIKQDVLNEIHLHGDSSMRAEICGILIGTMNEGHTDIIARIEGKGAKEQGANVTFTQETWDFVYKVKDEHYADKDIVGWYHTHPGFGIFLSSFDLFIHENFFSAPGQVAWVYDPHSKDEGCFTWSNKKIVKASSVTVLHGKGRTDGIEEEPDLENTTKNSSGIKDKETVQFTKKSSKIIQIIFYLTILLIGVCLGYLGGSRFNIGKGPSIQSKNDLRVDENNKLEDETVTAKTITIPWDDKWLVPKGEEGDHIYYEIPRNEIFEGSFEIGFIEEYNGELIIFSKWENHVDDPTKSSRIAYANVLINKDYQYAGHTHWEEDEKDCRIALKSLENKSTDSPAIMPQPLPEESAIPKPPQNQENSKGTTKPQ